MKINTPKLSSAQKLLHARALASARQFSRAQAEMLAIIIELDRAKLFACFGHNSTFEYCVRSLGLSEDVAASFISVARKAREVPAIQQAVENGLSISKARKITPVITAGNQEVWLQKVAALPYRELEKEIAKARPELAVQEKLKPVAENRHRLELGLDDQAMEQLKRVQDLVSTKGKKSASLEDALKAMLALYLEKEDPVRKAIRARPARETPTVKGVPAANAHEVNRRDQGRCQAIVPGGGICGNSRFTEIHHIRPRALGGGHEVQNLTTLCAAHHRQVHQHPSRDGFPAYLGSQASGRLAAQAGVVSA